MIEYAPYVLVMIGLAVAAIPAVRALLARRSTDDRLSVMEDLLRVRDYLGDRPECCRPIDTLLTPAVLGSHDDAESEADE